MIVNTKDLKEDIPVIEQDTTMTDEQVGDAGIDGKVHCKAVITKVASRYYLSIDFSCLIKSQCARCTEEFSQEVKGSTRVLLQESGAGDDDDLNGEVIVFESTDTEVDLRESIYEEIMLEGSIMPLCREDCPGIAVETIEEEESIDPRWDALKKLKDKK